MTKKEILNKHIVSPEYLDDNIVDGYRTSVENAMDEYAKEKAIAFGEWVDINAIRNGEHEWKYSGDNYTKKYTTEQLYEIFNQQNTGGITP